MRRVGTSRSTGGPIAAERRRASWLKETVHSSCQVCFFVEQGDTKFVEEGLPVLGRLELNRDCGPDGVVMLAEQVGVAKAS